MTILTASAVAGKVCSKAKDNCTAHRIFRRTRRRRSTRAARTASTGTTVWAAIYLFRCPAIPRRAVVYNELLWFKLRSCRCTPYVSGVGIAPISRCAKKILADSAGDPDSTVRRPGGADSEFRRRSVHLHHFLSGPDGARVSPP